MASRLFEVKTHIMTKEKSYKIYTRQGDKGMTSLLGGRRVAKYDDKIEAYGSMDELNAFIGVLRDQDGVPRDVQQLLTVIQQNIFTAEAHIAADSEELTKDLPGLQPEDVTILEKAIDQMNRELDPLENFILPGGHPAVSFAHVARTVCRRTERETLKVNCKQPVDPNIITYLNRLSDYFFVLGRHFSRLLDTEETKWISQKK